MNEMIQPILEALQPAFIALIELVGAVAIPALAWKLNEFAKSKVHDARFHCAMDKITRNAEAAVLHTTQTWTKQVRRSGSWDAEAAIEAGGRARQQIRALIGPKGLRELRGCLGQTKAGVDTVIDTAIESAVSALKSQGRIAVGGHTESSTKGDREIFPGKDGQSAR